MPQETPQGQGSAITYARRYGLCGALNIAADEDDDDAGLAEATRPASGRRARDVSTGKVTDAQLRNIGRLFGVLGVTERAERAERLAYTSAAVNRDVGSSKELTKQEASKLIDLLEHDCSTEMAG